MAGFQDIIGQEHIKEHFMNALEQQRVSHGYLFHGERKSGKEFIAKIFAMALQCEKEGIEPCQQCHSCKQALSSNHPDIILVTHEKPSSIGVEDIRLQVNQDICIKPYKSSKKVYIINDGEMKTIQAQNALLKTLEEPPDYAVIMLLVSNLSAILPTLISRCIVMNMHPVEDKEIKKYLMEKIKVPDYQANMCVAFARGNLGKAKALASSEDFDKMKEEAVTVLRHMDDLEIGDLNAAIKRIQEFKLDIHDYLDILMIWYRDVLLFKATNDVNELIFKEEISYIHKRANKSAYEGIERILNAIDKAKARLNANVNFDLAMELLMLTIKEN